MWDMNKAVILTNNVLKLHEVIKYSIFINDCDKNLDIYPQNLLLGHKHAHICACSFIFMHLADMLGYNPSRAVEVMGQARGSTGGDMEPFFDLNSHISNHRTLTTELRLEKRNCKRSLQDPTVISVTLKYLGHSRFLSSEPGLNSPRFLQAVQMLAQCQKNEDESIRATAAVLTAQTT